MSLSLVRGHESCRPGAYCSPQCPAFRAQTQAWAEEQLQPRPRPRSWVDGVGWVVLATPPDTRHLSRMPPDIAEAVGRQLILMAREGRRVQDAQARDQAAERLR